MAENEEVFAVDDQVFFKDPYGTRDLEERQYLSLIHHFFGEGPFRVVTVSRATPGNRYMGEHPQSVRLVRSDDTLLKIGKDETAFSGKWLFKKPMN